MDTGLAGKVVVVTGAARGMGRAYVEGFLDKGARMVALENLGGLHVTLRPPALWRPKRIQHEVETRTRAEFARMGLFDRRGRLALLAGDGAAGRNHKHSRQLGQRLSGGTSCGGQINNDEQNSDQT